MTDVFKLIEANGLTLHGDIEHFAELVRADERRRITNLMLYMHNQAAAYHNYYKHAAVEINRKDGEGKMISIIDRALAQPEMRPTTREEKIVRPGVYERLADRNFCPRCGKRLASGFVEISIHTCTPPRDAK